MQEKEMMKLSDVINEQWLDARSLSNQYFDAAPFPHIVLDNFIKEDVLEKVLTEFPDLSKLKGTVTQFNNSKEIKLAGKGM